MLQLLDEIFLDRTESAPPQQDIDETFRNDRADVDQKFPRDSRMRERDHSILDRGSCRKGRRIVCASDAPPPSR